MLDVIGRWPFLLVPQMLGNSVRQPPRHSLAELGQCLIEKPTQIGSTPLSAHEQAIGGECRRDAKLLMICSVT